MIELPDRIYSQYRNKPKFVDWMNIARNMGGDINAAADAVSRSYDVDTAVGEQLDVLARIVVVDRGFIADIDLNQSMFDVDADAMQFGDADALFSGDTAATDTIMSDGLIRIAIKAKIAKNNGDATIKSILNQMAIIAPNLSYIKIVDNQDMTFGIEFAGAVDPLASYALFNTEIIQRPQGVQFLGFLEITDFYMFDDDATAESFGETDVEFAYIGAF